MSSPLASYGLWVGTTLTCRARRVCSHVQPAHVTARASAGACGGAVGHTDSHHSPRLGATPRVPQRPPVPSDSVLRWGMLGMHLTLSPPVHPSSPLGAARRNRDADCRWSRLALIATAVVAWEHANFGLRVTATVSAPERAALVDLWTSVTGLPAACPNWASGDPCANGWTGVTCSSAPVAVTYVHGVSDRQP